MQALKQGLLVPYTHYERVLIDMLSFLWWWPVGILRLCRVAKDIGFQSKHRTELLELLEKREKKAAIPGRKVLSWKNIKESLNLEIVRVGNRGPAKPVYLIEAAATLKFPLWGEAGAVRWLSRKETPKASIPVGSYLT